MATEDGVLGLVCCVRELMDTLRPFVCCNQGISRESEIIDLGVELGFVEKAGAWYSVDGERIGQGKDNAREYLKEHTDMSQGLEVKIREKLMSSDHDDSESSILQAHRHR